jgi:hypothetical protein
MYMAWGEWTAVLKALTGYFFKSFGFKGFGLPAFIWDWDFDFKFYLDIPEILSDIVLLRTPSFKLFSAVLIVQATSLCCGAFPRFISRQWSVGGHRPHGEQRSGVSAAQLTAAVTCHLQVGDAIEARFGGGENYYPGEISKVNVGGTYDVTYHDGDAEAGLDRHLIRRLTPDPGVHEVAAI